MKIVSLSWNLVPRLNWICGIQWWCSLFLFLTINVFLGQIWSKNSKLFVQSEIWYKDQFQYKKFNGGVYFICFRIFLSHFAKVIEGSLMFLLNVLLDLNDELDVVCRSFATQNTSASFYSISTYQIKFYLPHPGYPIFNFPSPPSSFILTTLLLVTQG